MNRKVYAYWYKGEPLYHWCKNNNVSYVTVRELHLYKDMSIEDAVKYAKSHKGRKIKYQIDGVPVRQLLGPYKYTLFNSAITHNRNYKKNVPWEEVYKKLSTV